MKSETDSVVAGLTLHVVQATQRATWGIVRVTSRDGHSGVAECGDTRTVAAAAEEIDLVRALVTGRPLASATQVLETLPPQVGDRHRKPNRRLMRAIHLALADLRAHIDGAPLDSCIGEQRRSIVQLYANINRGEPTRTSERLAMFASRAVRDGFPAVKLAPFDTSTTSVGLQHLRAVREAIGNDIDLMVDMHHRLPVDEVAGIIPRLEELGVCWLEDAVELSDVASLRRLAAITSIPLVAGEQAADLNDVLPVIGSGALSTLMPDVTVAGIRGAYEMCVAALDGGMQVSLHNPFGPVATAASLHVAAALPSFGRLEYAYGEVPWRGQVVSPEERVVESTLNVPHGPGLGVDLAPFVIQGERLRRPEAVGMRPTASCHDAAEGGQDDG